MGEMGLRVGELAQITGLTVRTLRYYDSLHLLTPAGRTAAGHRLYGAGDVERLYRIQALRRLGFRLREIAALLRNGGSRPLMEVVADQLDQVRRRIAAERQLEKRLSALQQALVRHGQPTGNDLLTLIGSMTMIDQQLRHDYSEQAERYDVRVGRVHRYWHRYEPHWPAALAPTCSTSVAAPATTPPR